MRQPSLVAFAFQECLPFKKSTVDRELIVNNNFSSTSLSLMILGRNILIFIKNGNFVGITWIAT